MTPKEAVEMLNKCGTNTEQPYEDMILEALEQALTELEELKKRDTAMKVKQSWEEEDNHIFDCPHCGDTWFYTTDSEDWKFCPNCGQRLDWSDKDD